MSKTTTELFHRALAKIDRRLQDPTYPAYAREALLDHRKSLFDGEADFADLDCCLRSIDRTTRITRKLAKRPRP